MSHKAINIGLPMDVSQSAQFASFAKLDDKSITDEGF